MDKVETGNIYKTAHIAKDRMPLQVEQSAMPRPQYVAVNQREPLPLESVAPHEVGPAHRAIDRLPKALAVQFPHQVAVHAAPGKIVTDVQNVHSHKLLKVLTACHIRSTPLSNPKTEK